MNGVSLKELVKENIALADSIQSIQNENKRIMDLLKAAEEGQDMQPQTFGLIASMLQRNEALPGLIFKIAVMKDDEGLNEDAIYLYRFANMLKPDPKAINNIAVIYSGSNITEARKILASGLEQFPEDNTLRENFNLLK